MEFRYYKKVPSLWRDRLGRGSGQRIDRKKAESFGGADDVPVCLCASVRHVQGMLTFQALLALRQGCVG